MEIDALRIIYFSPTGTTKRVLNKIVEGINLPVKEEIKLHSINLESQNITDNALTLIAAPVYSGRIPIQAIERLRMIRTHNAPAVIVVNYGNRAIDDALIELRNETINQGFNPIAGGAFISEHSWSNDIHQIAKGRPDVDDLQKAKEFGKSISALISNNELLKEKSLLNIPGNSKYKERKDLPKFAPVVNHDRCDLNGKCASVCPVGAISISDKVNIDENKCILCSSCIKHCPENALSFENPWIKNVVEWFSTNLTERNEPEFFFEKI